MDDLQGLVYLGLNIVFGKIILPFHLASRVGGTYISTVYIESNQEYETMVFDHPAHHHSAWRYDTKDEAIAGHHKIVRGIIEGREDINV